MSGLSLGICLEVSEHVVFRELDGESVLLDLQSGTYYGLNEVGTRAWVLIERNGSLQKVHDAICEEFSAPAHVVRAELERFSAELCERGLCRTVGPG